MEKVVGLLSPEPSLVTKADPRLRLLLELEPRHEVFLSNLTDAFAREPAPSLRVSSSPPGVFWHDVFVPTGLPWRSIQESLLWHLVVIIAAWALTQSWASRPRPHVNQAFRTSGSIYYTPPKDFPSARSNPVQPHARARTRTSASATRAANARATKAMPVAAEQRGTPKLVVPPDLKLAEGPRAPNLAASPTMPAVPLSATARTDQAPLGGLNSVVAPPPDVHGRTKGLAGLGQPGVVAPPVDAKGIAGDRTLRGPGAAGVIAPPPSVQATTRGLGNLGAGNSQVVAPPPALQGQGVRAGAGMGARSFGGPAGAVVPPPPSVEHTGRAGSLSGPGVAVVPPPPSMQGAGVGGGNGRGTSASGVGAAVVPPPPSVQGGGGGLFASLSSWFSNTPSKVVPPPPGIQGDGAGGGAARVGSLAGGGSAVVPPPPSVQGGGNGRGRVTSLASGGSEVVPPPPSVQGAGGDGTRAGFGNSMSGGTRVVPPPPSIAGTGSGSGRGTGTRGNGGGLAAGTDVVPPPPSMSGTDGSGTGAGASGAGSRLGSLGGGGGAVVPPPPAVSGSGAGGAGGRVGSLVAGGGNVVAPPPSVGGGGGSGGSGRLSAAAPGVGMGGAPPAGAGSVSTGPLEQMDPLPDVPENAQSAPGAPDNTPPGEDVPLRLVGVPVASSKTSFFSNYEVFLAERRLAQGKTELIKLVYQFLPYQKRLSEYDLNTTKIYKLRVIQDPKCDESLMQMMWPEGGEQPDPETEAEANHLASKVADKNTKLQCYRTTADDFQRAISHGQ